MGPDPTPANRKGAVVCSVTTPGQWLCKAGPQRWGPRQTWSVLKGASAGGWRSLPGQPLRTPDPRGPGQGTARGSHAAGLATLCTHSLDSPAAAPGVDQTCSLFLGRALRGSAPQPHSQDRRLTPGLTRPSLRPAAERVWTGDPPSGPQFPPLSRRAKGAVTVNFTCQLRWLWYPELCSNPRLDVVVCCKGVSRRA